MGQWKNFAELEKNISLPELRMIIQAKREKEHMDRKFAASLKGIDLDAELGDQEHGKSFDEIERTARARLTGMSETQVELLDIGMGYEEEE